MMNTNQLPPGRERDEAIAKALGWKYTKVYGWSLPGGAQRMFTEPWPTDDHAAMDLLNELCRPANDGGRGWGGFTMEYAVYDSGPWWTIHIYDHGYHSADNLADAITQAVQSALEAERK